MSVGGQLPASLIYTVEMRPQQHWGYFGALVMMAAVSGVSRELSLLLPCSYDARELTLIAPLIDFTWEYCGRYNEDCTDRRAAIKLGVAYSVSLWNTDSFCSNLLTYTW